MEDSVKKSHYELNNGMNWGCVTKGFRRTARDSRFSKRIQPQMYSSQIQNKPQTSRFNTFRENNLASVKM